MMPQLRMFFRDMAMPLANHHTHTVWKRTGTSVSDVEVAPKGERGDCIVDEEMRRGRGRGGNVEEGTAGSRRQRLRSVGGPQHAQATSRSRRTDSSGSKIYQGLIDAVFGRERNLSSGPQCGFTAGKGNAREAAPTAVFVFSLTRCREGRAPVLVRHDLTLFAFLSL